mmetsp:Transcript_4550/g.13739  ORF Transcript_4550/g.13739 Transcript_4550/m.13739 type:complete len:256 (-) Transcript_4550:1570-2337(-)
MSRLLHVSGVVATASTPSRRQCRCRSKSFVVASSSSSSSSSFLSSTSTEKFSSTFSLGERITFQLATAQNRKRSKPRTTTTKTSAQLSLQSLKDWWKSSAKIDKKTIASLGSACLLSYGFVSNLFYVSSLLLATYTSIKTTGQSPVTSTESLKIFASSYFGLWMIQNVIRPARFAFSVAISPKTDKLVEFFQKYVPGNKKSYAFGLTVFCVNVLGTFAYMFGGFALIYALTGVPLDIGKLFGAAVAAKKGGGVVA